MATSDDRNAGEPAEPTAAPKPRSNVVRIATKAPPATKLPLRVPPKLRRHRGPPGGLRGDSDSAFATLT